MHAISTAFYKRRCAAITHIASLWFVCVQEVIQTCYLTQTFILPPPPTLPPSFLFSSETLGFSGRSDGESCGGHCTNKAEESLKHAQEPNNTCCFIIQKQEHAHIAAQN